MNIIPRKFYLDDIFDDFMAPARDNNMKCDVYEKEGKYHIELDTPGFTKDDISIEVKDGCLVISAEKKEETEDKDKNYIRRERSYGKYQRSFNLGDLDSENIEAEFKNGILKITVPKKAEAPKKVIEIKDNQD
jgi:HSP20 family protein